MSRSLRRLSPGPLAAFVCAVVFTETDLPLRTSWQHSQIGLLVHLQVLLFIALYVIVISTIAAMPLVALLSRMRLRAWWNFCATGLLLGLCLAGGIIIYDPSSLWTQTGAFPTWAFYLLLGTLACSVGFLSYWFANLRSRPTTA